MPELEILYEDNHLLAVNKRAGLATMGVAPGIPSVLEAARAYLIRQYAKPGNAYVGIVSRLDAPVTGALLLARTSKAASRLSEATRLHQMAKVYWAVVEGRVDPPEATLEHYLRKDERHKKVHATHAAHPDAQLARLSYRLLASGQGLSLLEVHLETGRKHQIRVQLAQAGWPVLGDRKYGGGADFAPGIALHSRRIELAHPVRRTPLTIEAPLPSSWFSRRTLSQLLKSPKP